MTKEQYKALKQQGKVVVQPRMDDDSHRVRHTIKPIDLLDRVGVAKQETKGHVEYKVTK